jgi:hypothetical protein
MKKAQESITALERNLAFAAQRWQNAPTKHNADNLIECSQKVVKAALAQLESKEIKEFKPQSQIEQAAVFFQEGDLTHGERFTQGINFVQKIQKAVESSMQWLDESLGFYALNVR